MATITPPKQKTAILFCCIPSHLVVEQLINALRRHGYHIPLLITCPLAFNYAMDPRAIEDMGKTIANVTDKIWDPPAILSVTSTKQCEDIYCSIDPDFALAYCFAYPISRRMLRMRAKVVNLHPGRLPIERGPLPGVWPTFLGEDGGYSMDDLCATFHYMSELVDCGPVIKEIPLKDFYPPDTTLTTRPVGLAEVATMAFLQNLDEVIMMVEGGSEGMPQVQPVKAPQSGEDGKEYAARKPTEEERTIQPDWSIDKVMTLWRALGEAEGLATPYFWWKGRRYWVERLEEWDWPGKEGEEPNVGDVRRVGFDLVVMFEGGAVRMATRTR